MTGLGAEPAFQWAWMNLHFSPCMKFSKGAALADVCICLCVTLPRGFASVGDGCGSPLLGLWLGGSEAGRDWCSKGLMG